MGHNLATATYGQSHPQPQTDYAKAYVRDGAVTSYAENNVSEDFAEASSLYITDPDRLRRIAPERFTILDALIGGNTGPPDADLDDFEPIT
jgi:hypothetical protein